MPIINSEILSESSQADGSRLVHERHTDHNGLVHDVQYYAAAGWDVNEVLAARASAMSAEIDRKEQQEAEARNFHLSISPVDFMLRLSPDEWGAFKSLADTDVNASYFWALFGKSRSINTKDPRVIRGVNFLASAGILRSDRVAEVLR